MRSISVKVKMSLVASLLAALGLSLLALSASWYFEGTLKEMISGQQSAMVSAMAEEIDGKFDIARTELVTVAGTIPPSMIKNAEVSRSFLDSRPDTAAIFDNGLFLFSPAGKLVATTADPYLIGKDYSFRDYFQKTVATGKPQISEPFLTTQKSGHPVIMFTAPIRDSGGNLAGIFGGSLDLMKDNFLGKLVKVKLGAEGHLHIYNAERTIIVHPDRGKILGLESGPGVDPLLDRAIEGFEGTGETVDQEGTHVLVAVKRLKTTNWILSAHHPTNEAYAPVYLTKWRLFVTLLVLIVFSILIVWWFMGYLIRPLMMFIGHLDHIAATPEELEPFRITTHDEIARLGQAFNRMIMEVSLRRKEVRAQKQFVHDLLEYSAVPTFVLDDRHQVILWNKACEELTGMKGTDVTGTTNQWKPFYPSRRPVLADLVIDGNLRELPSLYDRYSRSTLTPDAVNAEGWYPSLNGKERYILFDAAPVRDGEGEVIAAIQTIQDLTERKNTEEALQILSQAIEQSPTTVMITDREGVIEYVNPSFSSVTGYSAEEALGKNPRILKSDRHLPEFYTELWRTIVNGGEWRGEFCNKKKNGELCWQASVISPVKNTAGEITHFIAVQEDVTERKWAEEELRRSDEQVRLLLQSTGEAIYGVNLLGKCTFANPACARLLGYSHPNELLGKNMHLLIHHTRPDGASYPKEECPMYRVIHEGREGHSDAEVLWRADGTCFPAEFWSYPQRSGDKIVGAVVTFFDITERKKREEELRNASVAAEAATRAKSQFLANMSHEIRTPMNAVMGMLYLMLQTPLSEKQKRYVVKAQGASNSLLRIINDILDFSKIEAGKLEIEAVPFHLGAVLGNISDVASATINHKPVELEIRTAPDVPDTLIGDPLRLGQVLLNLTSNAIKFTDEGKVTVTVEPVGYRGNGVQLRFSVEDTGIGIAPEQQEKLVNAFTQADTSTTRRYGGTGLGLTISNQLVEMMGGKLMLSSEEGNGSTFSFMVCFDLPQEAEHSEQVRQDTAGVTPQAGAVDFSGVRVLVVEDNPDNQEVAREILEGRGVVVDVAANGVEAVERVATYGVIYHAVLMDVQMPVMDGLEATRRIRAHGGFRSLPIIAMTASAMSSDRVLCMDAGMDDQVTKPINVDEFFATLARWTAVGNGPAGTEVMQLEEEDGAPHEIPGIDIQVALEKLGSRWLLLKLLESFAQENAGTILSLRDSIAGGDLPLALRIVHTVKGVGSNLGATELAASALALESALKGEADAIPPALEAFELNLDRLMSVIGNLKKGVEGADVTEPAPGSPDRDRIVLLATKLLGLMASNNMNALEVWEELKSMLPLEGADRIDAALYGLNFTAAAQILEYAMDFFDVEWRNVP